MDLLHGEDYRTAGYSLFRAAEKDVASLVSARLSSYIDADLCFHWRKISCRWTWNASGPHKLVHSCAHVHLLYALGDAFDAEVPLVEKILDNLANREWNLMRQNSLFIIFLFPPLHGVFHMSKLFSYYVPQIQFLIVFCHTIQLQFQPTCNFPKSIGALLSLNAALFTYMFSSFYVKSYNKTKAARDVKNDKQTIRDENSNEVYDERRKLEDKKDI